MGRCTRSRCSDCSASEVRFRLCRFHPRAFTLTLELGADERIRNLEYEVHNLHTALLNLREEAITLARSAPGAAKVSCLASTTVCPMQQC